MKEKDIEITESLTIILTLLYRKNFCQSFHITKIYTQTANKPENEIRD